MTRIILTVFFLILILGMFIYYYSPRNLVENKVDYNIVLVSVDTLRADHLGAYGYKRNTSPNIDQFASRALLFKNVFATSVNTAESHMSIFTGVYPGVHGVHNHYKDFDINLHPKIKTLAEVLEKAGYTTVGFHGGANVRGNLGFKRGFQYYKKRNIPLALDFLKNYDHKRPFFLFFHTYWVHSPYYPSPEFNIYVEPKYKGKITEAMRKSRKLFLPEDDRKDVKYLIDRYDGCINEVDHWFKLLLVALEKLRERTIIIFTSDHGEEFMEHGKLQHEQLYNEVLKVPLIIYHPGFKEGTVIHDKVNLLSLTPTILDFLSLPPP